MINLYRNLNKTYEQYEVGKTDFIVEVCEDHTNSDYIEVWLYRLGYDIKHFMFVIKRTDDYVKIIENNVDDYIRIYEEEVNE